MSGFFVLEFWWRVGEMVYRRTVVRRILTTVLVLEHWLTALQSLQ